MTLNFGSASADGFALSVSSGASGITLGLGTANASGYALSTTPGSNAYTLGFGSASATGYSLSVDTSRSIELGFGSASASGFSLVASEAAKPVSLGFGSASATGYALSVTPGTAGDSLALGFGTANASGFALSITEAAKQIILDFGSASASGYALSVTEGTAGDSVTLGVGTASASGFALVVTKAAKAITLAFGSASASGFALDITEGVPADQVTLAFGTASATGHALSVTPAAKPVTLGFGSANADGFALTVTEGVTPDSVTLAFGSASATGHALTVTEGSAGGYRSDVTAHQTRVTTDGGTVADMDFLDGLIQVIEDEGVLADLVGLWDPNCGHKLNTGAVETLYDFSSNNNDAGQTTSGSRPTLETPSVAEKPLLKFDGTDDHLDIGTSVAIPAGGGTVIVSAIAEEGSTDANDWAIGTAGSFEAGIRIGGASTRVRIDNANQDLTYTDLAQDEFHSVALRGAAANSWTTYFDASTTDTFTESGDFDFDTIGSRNQGSSEYMDGHIGTILAFDSDIGETAIHAIRDYIEAYYTGEYRYEALGHRKRVEDGGGTVEDIAFLSDLFQELDDEGILSGLVGGWGAAIGMDVDGSGDAEQLYDITTSANDGAFTSNRSRISTPTGVTKQMLDANGLAASFALGSLESFSGAFSLVFGAILDGSGTEGYILGHSSSNSDGIQYESDRIRFRLASNNDLVIDVADRPSSNTFQVGAVTRDASNNGRSYWDATHVGGPFTVSGTFDLGRIGGRSSSLYGSFYSIALAFDTELTASNITALRTLIETYYTS